jgi:medium-chain acyl-[acyl-carrier-protein] hydrolase
VSGPDWLVGFSRRPQAPLQLLVCPFAGSGIAAFAGWPRWLGTLAELHVVLLPGRESRLREPPRERLSAVLPEVVAAAEAVLDRPFVVYGHSMGAVLAFELVRALERGGRRPERLVVSGRRAPHLPEKRLLHRLGDDALIEELRLFGGAPEMVLQDRDLMAAVLPAVRADLALSETYQLDGAGRVAAPITALGGSLDPAADAQEIAAWRERTDGDFHQAVLPGGHFFIHGEAFREALLRLLAGLASALERAAPPGKA